MTAPLSRDASGWLEKAMRLADERCEAWADFQIRENERNWVASEAASDALRAHLTAQSALADRMAEALRLTLAERTSAARLSNACQFADDVLAEYERNKQ